MTQAQCHHAIQRLCRQFAEAISLDEKRDIRGRQKALLRVYEQTPLTPWEKFEIIEMEAKQCKP